MGDNNEEQPRLALPAPSNNPIVLQPISRQPRQPHNLQGLLRFAMEATQAEDARGNSDFGPMDEERRKFLEEALRSLTVDVARLLQESTKILSDVDKIKAIDSADKIPAEVETAISNLMDFVDDIDVANDFYKIGGFSVFPVLLGSQCDALRSSACELLAVVCQNNPFTQARALETGLLNIVINMADNEGDGRVVAMTAYALSCATREFDPACKEFLAQNGCAILLRLLNFDNATVRTKAAFLIRYMCKHYQEAQDELLQMGLVSNLSKLLSGERDSSSEHILGTLTVLAESQAGLEQIQDSGNKLKETVEQYYARHNLKDSADLVEEKEYCEELLEMMKNCKSNDDDVER